MTFIGKPVGQYAKIENNTSAFSNFIVGDTVQVQNTTSNDGIYTVNAITTDGTHSYMGLSGISITEETDETDVDITPTGASGDKLIALGDEETGAVSIWSYNASTNASSGTILASGTPGVDAGTSGWTANAITPTMNGDTSQLVFTIGQSALRVCDSNDINLSIIKHYKFYDVVQFRSSVYATSSGTGTFLGWQESDNLLARPSSGGFLGGGGVRNTNTLFDTISQSSKFYPGSPIFYGRSNITSTIGNEQKQSIDYHLVRSLNKLENTGNGVYLSTTTQATQLNSTDAKDPVASQTYLKLTHESISRISIGAVIGLTNTNGRIDTGVTYQPERMFIRNIDAENDRMFVYRGYGSTVGATIDISATPYIVQYGCGFNFAVRWKDGEAEGDYFGYEAGDYEFAQSFIYDGNQESLLRTRTDMESTKTKNIFTIPEIDEESQPNPNRNPRLSIKIGAFGPYPARVTGGRIYIRKAFTDDDFSLLADIDLEKGVRTSLSGKHLVWKHHLNANVPDDCFYVGRAQAGTTHLFSDQISPFKYQDINNYYPDMKRNSIGYQGESYKCSTVGGERAWYGNIKVREGASGNLTKFGDRVSYSEYRKYDVIPEFNYINASEGDSDDIIKLEFFANKLFIFKTNSLHIWDVSNNEAGNWFPEQTIRNNGIQHPASVASTPYGIVWANRSGCFFYDGRQLKNISEEKLRNTENAYHGASLPPSWETFIQSAVYTVNPLVIFSPKEKQLYVMKDPTEGGGTENICYIYNFISKSWVYNDNIFTDGVSYTNPVLDWNDNVLIAHEDIIDTNFNLDSDSEDGDTDIITLALNRRFTNTSNWESDDSGTFTNSSGSDAFLLSTHSADTDLGGVKLQDDYLNGNADLLLNGFYRIMVKLNQNGGSAGDLDDVPFYIKLGGQGVLLTNQIDTVATEYTIDVQCGNVNADLQIYHESNNTQQWKVSEVNMKEITLNLDGDASSKIMVGDILKAGTSAGDEEFLVNLIESDKATVELGYNSTSKIAHSSGLSIFSYKAVFKQLSSASIATGAPAFITKDIDFDDPSRIKKIYKIYITYLNTHSGALANLIKVSADGNTSFAQTSIPTPHSASNFALTGTFLASQSSWNVATFSFDAPFPCQSIALYFNDGGATNGLHINDISFEYRIINKKVS